MGYESYEKTCQNIGSFWGLDGMMTCAIDSVQYMDEHRKKLQQDFIK